jgi:hypothetical protein
MCILISTIEKIFGSTLSDIFFPEVTDTVIKTKVLAKES